MQGIRLRSFLVLCALICAVSAPAQTSATTEKRTVVTPAIANVPMLSFADPGNGVSFRYPAAWTLTNKNSLYIPPGILQTDQSAKAVVTFTPAGNYYAKTNLAGLEFVYVNVPAATEKVCTALATANLENDSKSSAVTINGTSFLHVRYASAGMCHQMKGDIYETYRAGQCFLFEADFDTLCEGVVEGSRGLTDTEKRALARHLDGIIQTVKINPAK